MTSGGTPAAGEVVLEARGLDKAFGALQATLDLSLALEHGRVHALIGPNGAGKTTAMAMLGGQLSPDRGRILFEGRDITRLAPPQRARLGVARSFQITALCEPFTARENVELAVQARSRHHFRFWRDAGRDPALAVPAAEVLHQVGLDAVGERPAAELAHGQKRQLELAMALATEPKALLLDEPMAGMGPSETDRVTGLIERIKGRYAILLVEHDMDVVFALADRISVLVYGRLIASGTPAEVRADPEVQRAYLNADRDDDRSGG